MEKQLRMIPNTSLRPPHVQAPMYTHMYPHMCKHAYMYITHTHENGKPTIFVCVRVHYVSKHVPWDKCGDQRITSDISFLLSCGSLGKNLVPQAL